jgi:hypothetical protein
MASDVATKMSITLIFIAIHPLQKYSSISDILCLRLV